MCLSIPGRVIIINGSDAIVEVDGVRINARTDLTPAIAVGDYGLVHAGFIIQRLDEQDARETLRLFAEIAEASREADALR